MNKKILEIEGLRLLIALQVAVYHIWIQKVSGGVDIFFVITGFLITLSLFRRIEYNSNIQPFKFTYNILRRLFPHILLVIMIVLSTFPLIAKNINIYYFLKDTFFALLYLENWNLILSQDSYLNRTNDISIYKHLWATSVQAQFYIIWSLILLLIQNLVKSKNVKNIFTISVISIFIFSIIYSIIMTDLNQMNAYYNTFTRLYEFALGSLLALFFNKINVNKYFAILLSYLGLVIIFSFGLFVNVSDSFPGALALIPVLAVLFVLISTKSNYKPLPNKFLSQNLLIKFSYLAYPIYLWHWIIYIYHSLLYQDFKPSIVIGLIIILISILFAFIGDAIIKKINKHKKQLTTLLLFIIIVMGIVFILKNISQPKIPSDIDVESKIALEEFLVDKDHPGALIDQKEFKNVDKLDSFVPSLTEVKTDLGTLYKDNCNQSGGKSEIISCEYGSKKSSITIAIVGGSHTVQWMDPLKIISEHRGYRLITMTKLGCRFTDEEMKDKSCMEWNKKVLNELNKQNVDIVFTNADISEKGYVGVPKGYINNFNKLKESNIEVLALRDTPWLQKDIIKCLSQKSPDDCKVKRSNVLVEPGYWEQLDSPPTNVHYLDLSNKICEEDYCSPVKGNVVVYWDSHHITGTFSKTMTPFIDNELKKVLNKVGRK